VKASIGSRSFSNEERSLSAPRETRGVLALVSLCDALLLGSIMFFLTMFLMDGPAEPEREAAQEAKRTAPPAYDNTMFINDDGQLPTLELPRFPERPSIYEHSRL